MYIKKLLPLVFLFSVIFFEIKSSNGSGGGSGEGQSVEEILQQVEARMKEWGEVWKRKKTVLTLAAALGHVDSMRSLLESNADINEKDEEGQTALMAAASRPGHENELIERNRDTIRCLIAGRADVNVVDNEGKNALMLSLNLGGDAFDDEVFKLLVQANTDVSVKDRKGSTVLTYAAQKWLCAGQAIDLLEHAYVGGSQADQERWAAEVKGARLYAQQRIQEWAPFSREDKRWGDILLE